MNTVTQATSRISAKTLRVPGHTPPTSVQPLISANDNTETHIGIVSTSSLSEWTGSLTFFSGYTGTVPSNEIIGASYGEIAAAICPAKPVIVTDKIHAPYFVPCALKEAQFIGSTLDKAQKAGKPTVGKMRSKKHMTDASMLVVDVDGLHEEAFQAGLNALDKDGVTYLAYTTYSYGSAEKTGMRARIVVPVDRPLGDLEYRFAWHGFSARYFGGAA